MGDDLTGRPVSRRDALLTGGAAVLAALSEGCRHVTKPAPQGANPVTPPPKGGFNWEEYRTLERGASVPEFVMCPPTKLHPFNNSADVKHWQWLTDAIRKIGGKVTAMQGGQPKTGYGEVWTRDPVLVFPQEKVFFMGTYPETGHLDINRKIGEEAKVIAEKLERLGFKKYVLPHPSVDGGEVIVDSKKRMVFIGYEGDINSGYNVNRWKTANAMQAETGYKIVPVQRDRGTNPLAKEADFYHLDCGMGKLPNGEYLVSESAVTPQSMDDLQRKLGSNLIVVRDRLDKNAGGSSAEAVRLGKNAHGMAYNFIGVGQTLIMPYCSRELEGILERHKYKVITPEKLGLPEGCWKFSNGSVHCATQQTSEKLDLNHPDRALFQIQKELSSQKVLLDWSSLGMQRSR